MMELYRLLNTGQTKFDMSQSTREEEESVDAYFIQIASEIRPMVFFYAVTWTNRTGKGRVNLLD